MRSDDPSLRELHHTIRLRLGTAIGNLRLLAIGAPFGEEMIQLIERDLFEALKAATAIEQVEHELTGLLGLQSRRRAR